MRRTNRNRILRSIITRGPASRAELSRRTGMSRPTVSVIANELLTSGVLMEGDRVSSGGAPGTLLEIARDTGVTLVVDLRSLDEIRIAAVSPAGQVVKRKHTSVADEEDVLKFVEDFASGIPRQSMIGAAVAVNGFIDSSGAWRADPTGVIDVSVIDQMRRMLRMDVWPINVTDAISVANLRDSPEGLAAHAVVVMQGATLGLLIGGNPVTGSGRSVGDIGHIVPGTEGPQCHICGRRCVYAATQQLFRGNDTAAGRQQAAAAVAHILAPLCATVELEEVVLAELPLSSAPDMLQRTIDELSALVPSTQMPHVRLSEQGEDAVLMGAALIYLHKRLI
jgi:predicted NBD/HSP70 family sugar kinase